MDCVASGRGAADTLFECYMFAKDSVAFELERCGGMNTCVDPPPTPPHLRIPFSSSHSAALSEGLRRKEERSGEKKVSKDASQIVSLGSGGVKGHCGGGVSGVKWSRQANGHLC